MPPMEQLRYKPLDHESGTIRLVRLLPDKDEPIRLELISSNLDEEPHIPYEALSYVWGSPNKGQAVEVDGQQLTIDPNLNLALLRLRRANEDRILWIDSICINPSDDEEQREQVTKIPFIIARAERLITWLGESTPEMDLVFHSMQRLEKQARKNHSEYVWRLLNKQWLDRWRTFRNADKYIILQERHRYENVPCLAWAQSGWALQEIFTARFAEVMCGPETVSALMFEVTKFLIRVNPNLSTILVNLEQSPANVSEDKVYESIGLYLGEHTTALVTDHSKSSAEIVQDTVATVLGFEVGWKSFCSLPEWELSELYENLPLLVYTVSEWAIKETQLATLEAVMYHNKVHVIGYAFGPSSLLWEPILHGDTATVKLLFEMGADVNFRNEESCDALVDAVRNGHRQTVKLLLERFTKVDRSGDDYNNILRHADLRELLPEAGDNSHVLGRKNVDGSQVTSADDSISSTKNSHTYVNSTSDREEWDDMTKVNLGGSHRVLDTQVQQQKFEDVDVQSLVSEEDDTASSASMPLPSWTSETELIIIGVFAKSSVLSPLYSKALQLMPEERFINNFRRLLKAFHGNLVASDNSNITRQLAKLLRSKQRQSRIARMIIARHVAPQSSWNEEELANLRDQEKQAYTNVESWLDRTIVSSTMIDTQAVHSADTDKEYESDDDSDSESDGEENTSDLAQYPRLDLVVQRLMEGQPFQDMLASFKELLLPPGLLEELLPVPRSKIKYVSTTKFCLLSKVQGFLEEITGLEWDWWPLSPRMRPLKPGETRVHWECVSLSLLRKARC
jgi:hypothetical protein